MMQPGGAVFQDVPDEIDDRWTHGVLVGGMASASDDVELARAYARAASHLIEPALESKGAWRFSYPIFYLYRHALEIYLKAALRAKQGHDLRPLIEAFDKELRAKAKRPLPPQLKRDLLLFAVIDPDSQGFRYTYKFTSKTDWKPQFLGGEYWVPLRDLQEFMEKVFRLIEAVIHRR